MATIKVTKDGVSNNLLGSLAFAQQAYPTSEGYSHEDISVEPSAEETKAEWEAEARDWRNSELVRTDSLFGLTDHPDHSKIVDYRKALRDWPSTEDFPDTKPTL
tara:strand:- start:21 stop:332 length:312 start_codon:yes stop_codon:yes gene_type:complete